MFGKKEKVEIKAPNFRTLPVKIIGTAPYVQHAFGRTTTAAMREAQAREGAKSRKREARNPERDFKEACHRSTKGWFGIPAAAFRNAMIDACRLVEMPMTRAKMSVTVLPDGVGEFDGQPLVRIIGGEPEMLESRVRLSSGVTSLAYRPIWKTWGAVVNFRYDADQFSESDIANLIWRVGEQLGIGEGRPFSKNSNGVGWGTFALADSTTETKDAPAKSAKKAKKAKR